MSRNNVYGLIDKNDFKLFTYYCTTSQLADFYSVSTSTIRSWCKNLKVNCKCINKSSRDRMKKLNELKKDRYSSNNPRFGFRKLNLSRGGLKILFKKYSFGVVAKKLRVSHNTLRNYCLENKVWVKKAASELAVPKSLLIHLIDKGFSVKRISDELGFECPSSISRRLHLYGIQYSISRGWKEYSKPIVSKKCSMLIREKFKFDEDTKQHIKDRENNSCFLCGCKKNLLIHHVFHKMKYSEIKHLVYLCRKCHGKVHRKSSKFVWAHYLFNRLSEVYGYDYSDMNIGGDLKRIISLME